MKLADNVFDYLLQDTVGALNQVWEKKATDYANDQANSEAQN